MGNGLSLRGIRLYNVFMGREAFLQVMEWASAEIADSQR
jgi:hypothetical protein